MRGRLRHSFGVVWRERARAKRVGDDVSEGRAWKLFGLIPMMLLHRPRGTGAIGRDELANGVDHFIAGRWRLLISSGQECVARPRTEGTHPILDEQERRGRAAQSRIQQGQVSRARHELTGTPLPKNEQTFRELRDRRPREQVRPIPREVLEFNPSVPCRWRCARLWIVCEVRQPAVLLDPVVARTRCQKCASMIQKSHNSCSWQQRMWQGAPHLEVSQSFMLATMTAISKRDGGVRGIATGTVFRRLVAKTFARQFGAEVEKACAPFQFALSTRAGMDCVGHAIRAMTDQNPQATVLSIDGIGVYDHVLRSVMMVGGSPTAPGVGSFCPVHPRTPTRCAWEDEHGTRREVVQHEGGEQGDPLMPLLTSLAVHNSLCEVKRFLLPGEFLFAFLDDVHAVSTPERTRAVHDLLGEKLLEGAGIRLRIGKTQVWNQAAECPPEMGDFLPEVWSPEGMKILGTPVGTEAFENAACGERIEEEEKLWSAIHWIPDLQCDWQVLVQCVGPRCHHMLRTMPPTTLFAVRASPRRRHATGHGVPSR